MALARWCALKTMLLICSLTNHVSWLCLDRDMMVQPWSWCHYFQYAEMEILNIRRRIVDRRARLHVFVWSLWPRTSHVCVYMCPFRSLKVPMPINHRWPWRARATKSHSLAAVRILFYLCISGRAIIAVAQAGDSLIRYLCHSTSCRSLGVVFCLGALLSRAARFRYE